jgi:hypothetical protein
MELDNIFNKLRSDLFVGGIKRTYSTGRQYDLIGGGGYGPVYDSGTVKTKDLWQGAWANIQGNDLFFNYGTVSRSKEFTKTNARLVSFDPDVFNDLDSELDFQYLIIPTYEIEKAIPKGDLHRIYKIIISDLGMLRNDAVPWGPKYQGDWNQARAGNGAALNLRRHNERGDFKDGNWISNPLSGKFIKFVIRLKKGGDSINVINQSIKISMEIHEGFKNSVI